MKQRDATPVRPRAGILAGRWLLAIAGCSVSASALAAKVDALYIAPQQRVDLGTGRKMNLICIGTDAPTVVFESGLADWAFTWALVQPGIARSSRTCAYDRAGLGFSDPSGRAGNSVNMVDDLHHLLVAGQISPPYLLVGHSLGGLNVRLYADRFPDEVAGMVLLDPSHEEGIRRIDAQKKGQESRRYAAEIARWRRCVAVRSITLSRWFDAHCLSPSEPRYSPALNATRKQIEQREVFQQAQLSETINYADGTSFAAVRAARRSYGALPLVVLTADRTVVNAGPEWLTMQRELAALSESGVQRTIHSGHYVQLDQPQLVIETIAAMLQQIRAHAAQSGSVPTSGKTPD